MTSRPSFDSRIKYKHLTTLLQFSGAIVGSTPWASFPTVAHWIMRQNHLSFCNTTSLALSHRMGRWLFKDPPSGGGRSERHIPVGKPLLLVVKSHIPTPRASTHTPFPYHFPPPPPRPPSAFWYFTIPLWRGTVVRTASNTRLRLQRYEREAGRQGWRGGKMREESNDP